MSNCMGIVTFQDLTQNLVMGNRRGIRCEHELGDAYRDDANPFQLFTHSHIQQVQSALCLLTDLKTPRTRLPDP